MNDVVILKYVVGGILGIFLIFAITDGIKLYTESLIKLAQIEAGCTKEGE